MSSKRSDYQKSYRQKYSEKNRRISISVSNAEYSAFEQMARRENTKVTTLVKEYAFAGLTSTLCVPNELRSELQQLGLLVRNIANNVNQAAHYSNSLRRVANENGLLQCIKNLEDTIHEFVQERMKP